ncbi:hypothetical protein SDC9_199958 [bioreactor metagenome]|uniref:Uncharacterized protein n=1 Tax=bioreactor metagenome TaxID=1076179 RepID=A0A645IN76_9ZZZZ
MATEDWEDVGGDRANMDFDEAQNWEDYDWMDEWED